MKTTESKIAPCIVIKDLSKRYAGSDRLAIDGLSLKVMPGEIYGFLGPNGAGKSTTIRLLLNFIQPTGGTATIAEHEIVNDSLKIRRITGYLSGDVAMYPKMTGDQFLAYMSELQGAGNNRPYRKELAKRLQTELRKPLGTLSRGNRQKIAIIQALMHKPSVLVLDEPTSGLDPLMQKVFYELLNEAKTRGASVFVSSHILGEVQKMCDRVGIIRDGRLVGEKSIAEMSAQAAQTFEITFANKIPVNEIKKVPGVRIVSHDNTTLTIHMHGNLSALFTELAKQDVLHIDSRNLDLEETFMHFYEKPGAKK